jgi:hypothetical protein
LSEWRAVPSAKGAYGEVQEWIEGMTVDSRRGLNMV